MERIQTARPMQKPAFDLDDGLLLGHDAHAHAVLALQADFDTLAGPFGSIPTGGRLSATRKEQVANKPRDLWNAVAEDSGRQVALIVFRSLEMMW
tara:strand:- start:841 stop:1125 length:285 start_codon:yes stop_codon:yes gene_type:complete